MKYFLVKGYDKNGDYKFIIFTDNKENITNILYNNEKEHVKIHTIYGPYEVKDESLVEVQQPE